ncbi:MAG: type II toxin-antitoxin system VapB family antitoxin [Mobilicoccus sp.]|nr:type II toxin-antitoxin system VapB family antitoxin [Mobilicoccus sp.]
MEHRYSSFMPLNIKDPETDRLAREVARRAGESITVATRTALAERLERLERQQGRAVDREAILAIVEWGREAPDLDDRSADEILGYDERGLPS